jgi:hypothetical protein
MTQQTAVEWYDHELRKCLNGTVECDPIQILERAIAMEREQIEKLEDKISNLENMLLELGEQQ